MRTLLSLVLVMSFVSLASCSDDDSSSSSGGIGTSQESTCPTGQGSAGLCNGSHTPQAPTGRCQIANGCHELAQKDPQQAESHCKNYLGTWFPGERCSTQGLVGRCLQVCGRADEFVVFTYADDEYTWCNQCREAEGVWLGK